VTLTDVRRSEEVEFEVVGVNAAGVFGTGTSARLAPLTSAPTDDRPAVTPPGGTDQTSTPKGPSSVPRSPLLVRCCQRYGP
jgi:hypothetical protein